VAWAAKKGRVMQQERQHGQVLGSLETRCDLAIFGVLLAACLAYYCFSGFIYLAGFNHGIFDAAWRPIGRDFVNYWSGGVAVFDGMVPEIFDASLFHPYQERLLGHGFAQHNWSYPPHMLLLVWPLGLLPYLWALVAWSFVTLGTYLWASTAARDGRHFLLMALLLAPATFENFTGGQNGFLTGALLVAGLRLLGPRPILAGILFGLLTVKPQLGLLLPFALLAGRHWTAIVAAGLTTVTLIGLSILLFGWESWQAYIDLTVPLQTDGMNKWQGAFLTMMPSAYMGMRLLEAEPVARYAAQSVFTVTALLGVVWAFARSGDADLKLGALALGAVLASPYVFNYDMTAVSLAVALVTLRGLREGFLPGERVILMATWLLPSAVVWLNGSQLPIGSLILMGCFGYVLARIAKGEKCGADPKFGWAKSAKIA
jgi:hypothetical protein